MKRKNQSPRLPSITDKRAIDPTTLFTHQFLKFGEDNRMIPKS